MAIPQRARSAVVSGDVRIGPFDRVGFGRVVCDGGAVVGVGAVACRGVVGGGIDDAVDCPGGWAWALRGGEASACDASPAGAGAGAVCVAVVAQRAGGDFAGSCGW